MREATEPNPRIYLNPGAVRVSERIAEKLRHAADKAAEVADLQEQLGRRYTKGIARMSASAIEGYASLIGALEDQGERRDYRAAEADTVVAAELEVNITDPEDGSLIAEGILAAANYEAGTLVVVDKDGESYELEYVENAPAYEESSHTYHGRTLTVGIEVRSVPRDKGWVLR